MPQEDVSQANKQPDPAQRATSGGSIRRVEQNPIGDFVGDPVRVQHGKLAIPGLRTKSWIDKEWISAAAIAVPPLIAIVIQYQEKRDLKLLFAGAWLLIGSLIKIVQTYRKDRKQTAQESPEDLIGCLHIMHRTICDALGDPADEPSKGIYALRVTIHRVDGEFLEQVVPYVGCDGGLPGRRFPIRSGIIGLAARMPETYIANRRSDDAQEIIRELKADWHFTEEDAQRLSKDRCSWAAIPIADGDKVIAVIYLDAKRRDAFSGEEIQRLIWSGSLGMAGFIRRRYG